MEAADRGEFTLWFGNVYKPGGGGDQRSLFAHGRPQIEDSGGALSWKAKGQLGAAITRGPQTPFSKPPRPSLPQAHLPLPSLSHVSQMAVWCLPGCHLPHEGSDSLSCTEPGFQVCSSAYWSAQKTQTTAHRRSQGFLFLRWDSKENCSVPQPRGSSQPGRHIIRLTKPRASRTGLDLKRQAAVRGELTRLKDDFPFPK